MKKYDYLIVGSGLFGSVFAYEATGAGIIVLLSISAAIREEIYTVSRKRKSLFTAMARIFFIPIIRLFGIMLTNLPTLTGIPTVRLQIITAKSIIYRLI